MQKPGSAKGRHHVLWIAVLSGVSFFLGFASASRFGAALTEVMVLLCILVFLSVWVILRYTGVPFREGFFLMHAELLCAWTGFAIGFWSGYGRIPATLLDVVTRSWLTISVLGTGLLFFRRGKPSGTAVCGQCVHDVVIADASLLGRRPVCPDCGQLCTSQEFENELGSRKVFLITLVIASGVALGAYFSTVSRRIDQLHQFQILEPDETQLLWTSMTTWTFLLEKNAEGDVVEIEMGEDHSSAASSEVYQMIEQITRTPAFDVPFPRVCVFRVEEDRGYAKPEVSDRDRAAPPPGGFPLVTRSGSTQHPHLFIRPAPESPDTLQLIEEEEENLDSVSPVEWTVLESSESLGSLREKLAERVRFYLSSDSSDEINTEAGVR